MKKLIGRFTTLNGEGFVLFPQGTPSDPIMLKLSQELCDGLIEEDFIECSVENGTVTAVTLSERKRFCVTGKLAVDYGELTVIADDAKNTVYPSAGELPEGMHVGDKIVGMLNKAGNAVIVTNTWGNAAEADSNYHALLSCEEADMPFSAEAIAEARQSAFREINTLMAKRTDLRGKTILTLSPSENSRTECGFSVERDKNGNFILGLHTADVAAFVAAGSTLDKEAAERGKTVVLPDRELNMLPESLAKGPCFLAVGEDKLALSYFVTVSEEGKVLSFDFCESIINTAANCLFDEVDALILNYDSSAIMPLRAAYAPVMSTISNMFTLGGILQNARLMNGGTEFDKTERMFVYSTHGGRPVSFINEPQSDPKKLIREFLAVVGKELAYYLNRNGIPAIYRVQDAPDKEKLNKLRSYVASFGIKTDSIADDKVLAYIAEASHGLRAEQLIITVLRSILPKPYFSDKPERSPLHGTEMFCRFAYPLNRYADLTIQRIVKAIIAANEGEELDREQLHKIVRTGICSAVPARRRVSRIENGCSDIAAMDTLRRAGKKTYKGLVADITEKKIYIYLDNGCFGIVESKNDKYEIGDEVTVTAIGFDFEKQKLYVAIV